MRWLTALLIGAIMGFLLPKAFGGEGGIWMNSWAAAGTIQPVEDSPGLLFSVPVAVGAAICLRLVFNWHTR